MTDDKNEMFNEIFGDKGPFSGPDDPRFMQVMPMILALGGGSPAGRIAADGQIGFHDGPQIVLPKGMNYGEAFKILERHEQDAETLTRWNRQFNYRPDDGAYATSQVLRRMFGMALGESREVGGFFGAQIIPSETRDVTIELGKRVQVPWGTLSVPRLPGLEIDLCDRHPSPEYGEVFELHVGGPRKYKGEVEAIFEAVEAELRTNSIYRGKALTGSSKLELFDIGGFDAEQIVFADSVEHTLRAKLWSVLRYPDAVREQGVPLKRAVLLFGPYGTGKTSAGLITGQIAVENGWTFLSAKTGDDIEDVLRTARLYQRAVVFFEDIDQAGNDEDGLAELLDAFDGVTAKNGELIVVMTTNHDKSIPKGMLRPGRLDAVIKIAELDRGGTERLIRALVPEGKLDPVVDYDKVYAAMDGYLPAFVREAVSSAVLFAIERLEGGGDYVINTQDLEAAAESLRDQFNAHNEADEGVRGPSLDRSMKGLVRETFNDARIELGDRTGKLVLDAESDS